MKPRRKLIHYSQADKKFTEENYLTMTDKDIAEKLGKRKQDIGTLREMLTLRKRETLYKMGKRQRHIEYTDEHIQYLKDNYQTVTDPQMVEHFKIKDLKTFHIVALRRKLGLMKFDKNSAKQVKCNGMFNVKANNGNWIV